MSVLANRKIKDSGIPWIGEMPSNWSLRRYKHIFKERDERSKDGSETLLSVSAYTGVSPRSGLVEDGELEHRAASLEGYKVCHEGDLVMNIMLAWNRAQGISKFDGIVSPAYGVFSVVDDSDKRFLDYLVRCDPTAAYFKAWSYGIIDSRLRLYPETFGSLYCALPDTAEQSAIADYLVNATARIDNLVMKKTHFIELLREKRQTLITHAVTKGLDASVPMKDSGVEWLGDVPAHWTVCKLNFRYSVELGKMLDAKRIKGTHLVPYLRNQDVQWHGINSDFLPTMDIIPSEFERYTAVAGDLLVCEGGEVGRAAIWQGEPVGYQKALHRLRPRRDENPEFMCLVLRSAKSAGAFEEGDTKSTISHLPAEKFRDYKFVFPPVGEQRQIAQSVRIRTARIDTLIAKTERSIELLREHRAALITAAVTGKINLRDAA